MKEFECLKFFENKEIGETIILNRTNGKSIRINSQFADMISDVTSSDDVRSMGSEYEESDRVFFDHIADTMDKYELFKDKYATDKINSISFITTDKCNLFCKHCCFSAKCIGKSEEKILFDTQIFQAVLDLKPEELSITGGEPLLLSNFNEMIDMIKSSFHGRTALCTNGTLINEDNAPALCDCFDIFDISLDGYDEKSSEAVRGKGTFKKVLSAIEILKANNAKLIRLSCAIKGKSDFEKSSFEALCKKLDVQPLIRRMTLSGRAAENEIDDVNDYSCFTDLTITSCYDCAGGKTNLTVDWKGDIYPCNNFVLPEYKMCNIFDKDVRSKFGWKKDMPWFKEFAKYLPDKREECKNCEVNMFCWNCPSTTKSFLDSRKITSLRSICSEKKRKIMEAIWE